MFPDREIYRDDPHVSWCEEVTTEGMNAVTEFLKFSTTGTHCYIAHKFNPTKPVWELFCNILKQTTNIEHNGLQHNISRWNRDVAKGKRTLRLSQCACQCLSYRYRHQRRRKRQAVSSTASCGSSTSWTCSTSWSSRWQTCRSESSWEQGWPSWTVTTVSNSGQRR